MRYSQGMTTWTKDNVPEGNKLYELYFASQAEESDPDPYTFPLPPRIIKLGLTSPLGVDMKDIELRPLPDCDDPHTNDHHYAVKWLKTGEDIATLIAIDHSIPEDQLA